MHTMANVLKSRYNPNTVQGCDLYDHINIIPQSHHYKQTPYRLLTDPFLASVGNVMSIWSVVGLMSVSLV